MRPSKINYLFCWGLVILVHQTFGQDKRIELKEKFNRYKDQTLVEKIYLHTDRDFYIAGEYLWFKAYYIDGTFHKPLDVSKVAYIEIIGNENKPVLQTKIELDKGSGSGSLFLPATIASGDYQIRAYTNWMKNFSPDFYFHKTITIVNTFKNPEVKSDVSEKQTVAVQFFPEGGNLVYGLQSKVAFQILDQSGKGINLGGVIINQMRDTVVGFKALKFGIGSFEFTPQENSSYTAIVRDTTGSLHHFEMPIILTAGYVMHVADSTDQLIKIDVQCNVIDSPKPAYLFGHTRQIIKVAEMSILDKGRTSFLVNKDDLGEGISHFTIFDESLRPVCERLYFKRPAQTSAIRIHSDQKEYGVRRKVTLEVSSDSEVPMHVSLSILKLDSLDAVSSGNIVTNLWLTSDLQGAVEAPEYYFASVNKETDMALDNLLLTHGWRRFSWNNVLDKPIISFNYFPEWRGHVIQGEIRSQNGEPLPGKIAYLSSPGKVIRLYASRSDATGKIKFETKNFSGTRKVIVQTDPKTDSTNRITIEDPFSNQFKKTSLSPFRLDKKWEIRLLARSISMQVQDIYHTDSLNHFSSSHADSLAFYGKADELYYLDDYTRFPVMEEVMREYVPGVWVRKRKDDFHFMILDKNYRRVYEENPMILLDGVPVFRVNDIMAFDPLKIQKLEVVSRKYYLGPATFMGIVSYSSYSGDLAGFEISPRSVTIDYEGLQQKRKFYSPLYGNQKQRESRLPDQRSVLYWNPEILISPGKSRSIEFYTSDVVGNYKISAEGLTSSGSPGQATGNFKVIRQ